MMKKFNPVNWLRKDCFWCFPVIVGGADFSNTFATTFKDLSSKIFFISISLRALLKEEQKKIIFSPTNFENFAETSFGHQVWHHNASQNLFTLTTDFENKTNTRKQMVFYITNIY